MTADGGGIVIATLNPIQGGEQIGRFAVQLFNRAPDNVSLQERTVNGQPGLVGQQDGVTVTVFAFEVAAGRIRQIWAIRNPDKLQPWRIASQEELITERDQPRPGRGTSRRRSPEYGDATAG